MRTVAIAVALTVIAVLTGTWLADRWHSKAVDAAYASGKAGAEKQCRLDIAEQVGRAQAEVRTEAEAAIAAAQNTAQARETVRTVIDTRFIKLKEEAAHAPVADVDRCVLPADRLRRWSEANTDPTGPWPFADQGAATGEPAPAPQAPAATGVGADARPGAQPPAGGRGLSPARGPDVRAADPTAGLPT